jgi:hypothetical protein
LTSFAFDMFGGSAMRFVGEVSRGFRLAQGTKAAWAGQPLQV